MMITGLGRAFTAVGCFVFLGVMFQLVLLFHTGTNWRRWKPGSLPLFASDRYGSLTNSIISFREPIVGGGPGVGLRTTARQLIPPPCRLCWKGSMRTNETGFAALVCIRSSPPLDQHCNVTYGANCGRRSMHPASYDGTPADSPSLLPMLRGEHAYQRNRVCSTCLHPIVPAA